MGLVWGLFQVSEKIHIFLHVPRFCPDKFTIYLLVFRFSVSLTCFMSFLTALVLWYLPQLSSTNIDLFVCSLSPVLLIGFENRGNCTYVCVFCMTSEIILVFKVCSYFRRTIIFSLALMNLLQCSCLENPRDRGARWAPIYGATQSQTRLKRLSSSGIELNENKYTAY